ncbi:hypothetical protein MPDQ_006845 [Monascus purpureus]|uniref:Nicotinamide n-methyltransferase n=1 Tax=Monascus purpureus TaxID=5098 RepID=A0A507QTJ1_MONPU|nr:hypothetical protein MPDQ_006845 [Monascus purpureus]
MLHSRLRPLPSAPSKQTPDPLFKDEDQDNNNNSGNDSDAESPEDVFTSFLPHLFPDDAPSFHGDPGQHLLYSSPVFGDLKIMVPSYPFQSDKRTEEIAVGLSLGAEDEGRVNQVVAERRLFAHFLWSAAMVVAEGVERSVVSADMHADADGANIWDVRGESVLELGAGAALPSLICALSHASRVTITDHPSSPALSSAIAFNIDHNLSRRHTSTDIPTTKVTIEPHEWGTLDTPFAQANKGTFTRIIAADCLWMRSQHENLVRTMLWFLADNNTEVGSQANGSSSTKTKARVWIAAGFHTGRAIVASFFDTAVRMGLVIESIYERDLNSMAPDGGEVRRDW